MGIFAENEKDNDSRGGQATQALIQRRRRPKRRSTGVCNVSAEDGEAERQDSPVDGDEVTKYDILFFFFISPKKKSEFSFTSTNFAYNLVNIEADIVKL